VSAPCWPTRAFAIGDRICQRLRHRFGHRWRRHDRAHFWNDISTGFPRAAHQQRATNIMPARGLGHQAVSATAFFTEPHLLCIRPVPTAAGIFDRKMVKSGLDPWSLI